MDSKKEEDLRFLLGFLWGTATSAHQVEGDNIHNDWWVWEKAGKNKPSGKACDQYHLYEKDFDLVKSINNNAHRLSIEWSRIEPEEGKWNQNEVEHYRKVFQALKERNLKIMLTLHHFTNPIWFAKKGGWENPESIKYFSRFTEKIAKEYGQDIDFWITINEPVLYAFKSFFEGDWPPGKKSFTSYWRVLRNLRKAHIKAYKILHDHGQTKVGIAQNVVSFPIRPRYSFFRAVMLPIIAYFWNHWIFKKTRKYHDFIGLNYYFHYRLSLTLKGIRLTDPKRLKLETSEMGWEIYPRGLKKTVLNFRKFNLPIYITENGIATSDENQRIRFLVSYLAQLNQAIKEGADIRGYFYWSLLDNFEWTWGLGPRFGLVKVDFQTQQREITPAGKIYRRICANNAITQDLKKYIKEE